MALVHPNPCECTKSELDLFEVPPTQTIVAYGYWEQKGLTSALTDQGPYEFAVSGAGQERTRWDPKDGELCLSRTKPEETLVEVRSDSDVQIDRQTWV